MSHFSWKINIWKSRSEREIEATEVVSVNIGIKKKRRIKSWKVIEGG